jgi:hypothetical protein
MSLSEGISMLVLENGGELIRDSQIILKPSCPESYRWLYFKISC